MPPRPRHDLEHAEHALPLLQDPRRQTGGVRGALQGTQYSMRTACRAATGRIQPCGPVPAAPEPATVSDYGDERCSYVNLGNTGLRVSRVCLGMMSFGHAEERPWALPEAEAEPIIRRAVEGGITFFDTADVYNGGESEVITGRVLPKLLSPRGARDRDEGARPHDARRERPRPLAQAHHGLDRRVAAAARDGLRRPLPDPPLGSARRRSRRRWRRSTTSSRPARRATSGRAACSRGSSRRRRRRRPRGTTRFVSMQNHYNLVYREEEREMIPQCLDQGVARAALEPARARAARRGPAPARASG